MQLVGFNCSWPVSVMLHKGCLLHSIKRINLGHLLNSIHSKHLLKNQTIEQCISKSPQIKYKFKITNQSLCNLLVSLNSLQNIGELSSNQEARAENCTERRVPFWNRTKIYLHVMNKWRAMKRKHWRYLSQTGGLGTVCIHMGLNSVSKTKKTSLYL